MIFSERNIEVVVKIFKWFYLLLGSIGLIPLVYFIINNTQRFLYLFIIEAICFSIFFGLHKSKNWAPITIIIFSTLNIIQYIFSHPTDKTASIAGSIGFFNAFLVFFFSRKEVRKYFVFNSTTIY